MPQTRSATTTRNATAEIAATIARLLGHFWAVHENNAARQAQIEDWIHDLREFGPELVRLACDEYRRRPGHIRPGSGDIRQICIALQHERAERKRIADERAARWPRWLEEIWGPWPDGAQKRAEAMMKGANR